MGGVAHAKMVWSIPMDKLMKFFDTKNDRKLSFRLKIYFVWQTGQRPIGPDER
jgi:hypothetical protein